VQASREKIESKYFIEWTTTEAEVAAELVERQIQLVRWQRTWSTIWPDIANARSDERWQCPARWMKRDL
jgi:hypothetical protein